MKHILALLLTATPALAQLGGDTLEIRDSPETHVFAEVVYHNAYPPRSSTATHYREHNGVEITIRIEIGPDAERFIVTVPSGEYVAVPEIMDVLDGDTGIISIVRPMF